MELTYIDFLNRVKLWFSSATISGITYCKWADILLEKEIELNPLTKYPACFITPQPWQTKKEWLAQYTCRVYLISQINLDRSNRFIEISKMYDWVQAALQQIPEEFNGLQFPLNITPIVIWDLQGDGLYIDITLINNVPCY